MKPGDPGVPADATKFVGDHAVRAAFCSVAECATVSSATLCTEQAWEEGNEFESIINKFVGRSSFLGITTTLLPARRAVYQK